MAKTTYYGLIDYRKKELGYVLFSSPSNNIDLHAHDYIKGWNGTLETSVDNSTWTIWDGTTTVSSNTGKLYVRGSNNTYITGGSTGGTYRWVLTGTNISISGNIECLLDYQTVMNGNLVANPNNYTFASLFRYSTTIIDASKLSFPRINLIANYCYYSMFGNCTNLEKCPELPATILTNMCYQGMFSGCTNLENCPKLPATTLATYCYYSMFAGCTNLETLPELPATTISTSAYTQMFNGCSKIKLSETQTGDYQTPYRIPTIGTGTAGRWALDDMFNATGGTFTGTPTVNTTYYTSNEIVE